MTNPSPPSLDDLLERFPWSQQQLAAGKPLEWLWHFELSCTAAELWPHMIETSRFNRAMGLKKMTFVERDGVLHGQSVNGGVRHEWVEVPWEWVSDRALFAVREYSRGFGHCVRCIYWLEDLGDSGGVRASVYFGWIPRGAIGRLALKLGMPSLERGYRDVLAAIVEDIDRARPVSFELPGPEISAAAHDRISELRATLVERGLPETLLEKITEFIRTADDLDAYRIQVRRLAHEWDIDERKLLFVFLHATRAGLLDMSWDVICPHCRGVREESGSLSGLSDRGACDVCDIEFGTDLENAIEITFHVHPSIRTVPKVYYCSAEPSTKLHIKLQQTLAPGETRTVATCLGRSRYRMRTRGDTHGIYLTVRESDGESAELSWEASERGGEKSAGASPEIALANDTDDDQTFVIEEVNWSDEALRPADLFNLQQFRDLFSEEYLGADVQLSIGEQTILFTDMVGSTKFYAARGDPEAFVEIRRHFDKIFAVVHEHSGVIIKTIGDAAMASFSNPVDAVRAAKEIHAEFPSNNGESPIQLRISLNTGPCIAVNLNSNIDYFGGTVNIAAKLQACAESGQIAMSKAVYSSPGVNAYLDAQSASVHKDVFEFKAMDPISYWRWDTEA